MRNILFRISLLTAYGLLLTAFIGCGRLAFWQAQTLEKQGRWLEAIQAYDSFYQKYPEHVRTPQALYQAGRIYMSSLGLCEKASPFFERTIRLFPQKQPWVQLSREALFQCPDYFPLDSGMKWVYVDSQTGGRNMRQEVESWVESKTLRTMLKGQYYAGKKRFKEYAKEYRREDWEVRESDVGGKSNIYRVILKYPFKSGMEWVARSGSRETHYKVIEDHVEVEVRAGKFAHCLKIKEQVTGYPSWKYDYYAPGVGRVLTTVGGPNYEHRNTELLSYSVSKVQS
ncbi:MAG: tetratricopeptide repeat protein [Elusimicrobia bacterium]|nr:tetratricopeptide repeat protein [Elusimicrobiota bacterium]